MRLPRMTMCRWMIAVVLAVLVIWAARLLLLSSAYRERARQYQLAALGATQILMGPNGSHSGRPSAAYSLWAERMAEKCLRAARSPWLPVEPDLPEPESGAKPR